MPINIHEQNLQKKEKKIRQNSSHQKTQTKDQPFQTETFCSNTTKTELKGNWERHYQCFTSLLILEHESYFFPFSLDRYSYQTCKIHVQTIFAVIILSSKFTFFFIKLQILQTQAGGKILFFLISEACTVNRRALLKVLHENRISLNFSGVLMQPAYLLFKTKLQLSLGLHNKWLLRRLEFLQISQFQYKSSSNSHSQTKYATFT